MNFDGSRNGEGPRERGLGRIRGNQERDFEGERLVRVLMERDWRGREMGLVRGEDSE